MAEVAPDRDGTRYAATDFNWGRLSVWRESTAQSLSMIGVIGRIVAPVRETDGTGEIVFTHADDPGEQLNRASQRPEVVQELRSELDGWVETRMRETGLPDPIAEQPIALRSIGPPPAAPPAER